jgi:hypothetical protein
MKVTITLNGTAENPYFKMGVKDNPFPPIVSADPQYDSANRIIRRLRSEPIKDVDDLRKKLKGCDPEFVRLCVNQFKPGKRVRFDIEFPG